MNKTYGRVVIGGLLSCGMLGASFTALAANECKVQYGYHTGSGLNRVDKTKTVYLNTNQTKTINQSKLNFVKSLKNQKVLVDLNGAVDVTLEKNHINPPVGFYLTPVTLNKLKCLGQSSGPAFGSPESLIAAFKQANKTATQIAQGLKNTFNLGGQQVAQLLKTAGYTPAQIATALKNAFNAPLHRVAGWLKQIGFTGAQAAAALKNAFNAGASQVAAVLKNTFNQGLGNIATSLKTAGYTLINVANALESLESDPAKLWSAIKSSFSLSADKLVETAKQMRKYITSQNCGAAGCLEPAKLLKTLGYKAKETLKALKKHFNISVKTAYDVATSVFNLSKYAAEQALAYAGYSAREIATVVTNTGKQVVRQGVALSQQPALVLYDAYFKIVANGSRMSAMHRRYRDALNAASINVNAVKVGYSSYLDLSDVAMTDCNRIYFPDRNLVNKLHRGLAITSSELGWLLHELGHTMQCRSSSRKNFANRWFKELSPAVIKSIQDGKPDAKAIHDAMPLERDADTFRNNNLNRLRASLGIR